MNIKELNESLEKVLVEVEDLSEYYDDYEDDDYEDEDDDELIPSEAEIVADGPGASSYIMKKNGKYYVYWNIYGSGEEEGGVYDSIEGAYKEIVNDFTNFDNWDEIEDSCTFYDDTLKQLVKERMVR